MASIRSVSVSPADAARHLNVVIFVILHHACRTAPPQRGRHFAPRGRRVVVTLALLAALIAPLTSWAQTPEEPNWSQPAAGAVTLEEELADETRPAAEPSATGDSLPAPNSPPPASGSPATTANPPPVTSDPPPATSNEEPLTNEEPGTTNQEPPPATDPPPATRDLPPATPEVPPIAPLDDFAFDEVEEPLPDDMGVPSDGGFFLPDLTNPADPFFQLEGLHLRLGELHLRLLPAVGTSYNDNIFASNQDRVADIISTFSPALAAGIGDYEVREQNYFTLVYTPQFQFFAENTTQNTTNEFLTFDGQYSFSRLVTGVTFTYQRTSDPVPDQVGRNEYTTFNFRWDNSYALASKTFLELGLNGQYQSYSFSIDYTTVSADLRLAYQFSEKLRLSLGPSAGITYVENGEEQPFQAVNLGFEYDTLKKFRIRGDVGIQARQFTETDISGDSNIVTPTFTIGATYLIKVDSSVDLAFSRTIGNSGFSSGQSQITNTINLSYTQRVLTRFRLGFTVNYQILQYQGFGTQDRNDAFLNVQPSIAYLFWRDRCSVTFYVARQQRYSELEFLNYNANSAGTSFSIEF